MDEITDDLGMDDESGNACHLQTKNTHIQYAIEFIGMLVVGIIGILGNTTAIYVFSTMQNRLKFHCIMIMIFLFDTSYIILNLIILSFPYISDEYKYGDTYCHMLPIVTPLQHIALTGSIYSTMAISMERYLVVCHPFFTLSNRWSSKRYIFPILVFSMIYNIPRFFELEVVEMAAGVSRDPHATTPKPSYSLEHTPMRVNYYYNSIYRGWLNLFVTAIIPFIVLITLNVLIFKRLKQILRTRNRTSVIGTFGSPGSLMTQSSISPDEEPACVPVPVSPKELTRENEILLAKVSVIIVIFFIICHSVRWIPIIYGIVFNHYIIEHDFYFPEWIQICQNISGILTITNSSVNFYIYLVTHFHLLPKNGILKCLNCKLFCGSSESEYNDNPTAIPLVNRNGESNGNLDTKITWNT